MTLRALQASNFNQTYLLLKRAYETLPADEKSLQIAKKVNETLFLPELAYLSEEAVDWRLFEISQLTSYFQDALPLLLSLVLTGEEHNLKKAYLFLSYGPQMQFNEDWQLCTALPLMAYQLTFDHEDLLNTLTLEKPCQMNEQDLLSLGRKCHIDLTAVQKRFQNDKNFFDSYGIFLSLLLKVYEPDMSEAPRMLKDYFITLSRRAHFSPLVLLKCRIVEQLDQELEKSVSSFDRLLERLSLSSEGFTEGVSSLIELKIPALEDELETLIQIMSQRSEKDLFLTETRGQLLASIAKTNKRVETLVQQVLQLMPIPNFEEFHILEPTGTSFEIINLDGSPTSATLTQQWLHLSLNGEDEI